MSGRVQLFTFKEGLLSRVAHDLRLHVERFEIVRADDEITARFETGSIVVDGVMHGAQLDPHELSARDRSKIVETMREQILQTRRYPAVTFRGRLDEKALRVAGELTMVGVPRPLTVVAKRAGTRLQVAITLRPSEWGIQPYSALAGTIRLQDRVRVELELDAAPLGLG